MVAYYEPTPITKGMDEVFRGLADPTRRSLLDSLYQLDGQTLGQLAARFRATRQAVTKHLAVLEAANLVVTRRRGREKLHYLNPVPIHEIYQRWAGKFEGHQLQALAGLKQELQKKTEDKKKERGKS